MNIERESYQKSVRVLCGSRVAAYYPGLARTVGGVKAMLLLSQLLYWNGVHGRKAGVTSKIGVNVQQRGDWVYKSVEQMRCETGLSKNEQQTARKALLAVGVIEARLKGIPRTWHYRVDLNRLATVMEGIPAAETPPFEEPGFDPSDQSPMDQDPADGLESSHPDNARATAPGSGTNRSTEILPAVLACPPEQPHPTDPPLNGIPTYVGRQTVPTLGESSAQLNKESENTTETTKEKERALRSEASAAHSEPDILTEPGADKTGPPRDPRLDHPAVVLVKTVTGRYPPKAVFDWVIRGLGDTPDAARFAQVHEAWCARGYRPTNLEGHLDWYRQGVPSGRGGQRSAQAPPVRRLEEKPRTEAELAELRALLRATREAAKKRI